MSSPAEAKRSDVEERRSIMRAYAKCVVSGYGFANTRKAIHAAIDNPPASAEARRGAAEIAKSWCATEIVGHAERFFWLAYSAQAIRGQLFRALLLKRSSGDAPPSAAATVDASGWRLPAGDPYRPTQIFGECVARRAPREGMAVVSTKVVGAREEADAYVALRPALADCVSPGETVGLTRAHIEAALSEAFYHFASDAPTLVQGTR